VAIVGGSLGGLFRGIVLVRLGYDVTIFKRTPAEVVKDQGAGISASPIIPPIVEALKKVIPSGSPILDFLAEYDRTGVTSHDIRADGFQCLRIDSTAKSNMTLPQTHLMGTTSWDLLYNTLRTNFDGGYEDGYVAPAPRGLSMALQLTDPEYVSPRSKK
jgi:2-polyprenyl-6-methoxyphenol hydroxylase-like FAD-dependent oxidoreductase